jgi:hypothetical protein
MMLSFKACHVVLFFLSLSLSATAETVRGVQRELQLAVSDAEKVKQWYCRVLQRPADSTTSIDFWVNHLKTHTIKDMVKSGTQEQEFINNFIIGKSSADIVSTIYDVVLGRVGDLGGFITWAPEIGPEGQGYGDVVDAFLASPEYALNFGNNNLVPGGGREVCGPNRPVNGAINLGTAANFAILAKTGITTVPNSSITGSIGVSPIAAAAMTGFSLEMHAGGLHSTSAQITGQAYAATYNGVVPAILTTAVSDMEAAYTNAAGRAAGVGPWLNPGAGSLSGVTLTPGVYTFGTDVTITTAITFLGGANEVFIIQISKNLVQEANIEVQLSGGALAKNIFWQVAGNVQLKAGAKMKGILLVKTHVAFGTGAELEGRVLAQTACTLDQAKITPT